MKKYLLLFLCCAPLAATQANLPSPLTKALQSDRHLSYLQTKQITIMRDYERALSNTEADHIRFIVTTLADKPVVKLWLYKSALESAGDEIQHVHPLRFLECIFSDEQLLVAIRNVRRKSLAWDSFMDGVSTTMSEENTKGTLTTGYLQDFASQVGVNMSLITPHVMDENWHGLVDTLIQRVPREGDHGRYDM